MNELGISVEDGAVYEGSSSGRAAWRVHPTPLLCPFRLETTLIDIESNYRALSLEIFREDSFDPVTKIRRGRVYTRRNLNQPCEWRVQDPHRTDLEVERWGSGAVNQKVSLTTYQRDPLLGLRTGARSLPKVILGAEPFLSFWKLVSIENSSMDVPVLTLKALYSLGDLPELIAKRGSAKAKTMIRAGWEQLDESISRGTATAIVDRCRDLLSVVFGEKSGDLSRDLGYSINEFVRAKNKGGENLITHAGRIVGRLHARGKPNEQHARSLRPLSNEDAQLAVYCVGMILIETGWAK